MWTIKHRPNRLDDFIGKSSVDEVRRWSGGPVIIYGPTGCGKSLLAELIVSERGWVLTEVSDENIESAKSISSTGSLWGSQRVILIEDVDAVKDIKAVGRLVDESTSPIILTTCDYASRRLSSIKKKCASIQLRRPLPASIAKYLRGICEREGVDVEEPVFELISKSCQGDIRAAVTDLEMMCVGRKKVVLSDVDGLMSERDRKTDIYKALSVIFGGRDFGKVLSSTWDLSEQLKDVLWWVDENTPHLFRDKLALCGAYRSLSRADVFLGRIKRRQYWGFLRYANALMTCGVNSSRPDKINYTQYRFPGYFAALGRTNSERGIEDSIAGRLKPHLHVSSRVVRAQYIPLYRKLLAEGALKKESLSDDYGLSNEELDYLSQ